MKRATRFGIVLLALAALTAAAASADGTNSVRSASETAQAPRKTKLERLAEKMLPQQKVDEALGFFGPVSKKYLPVWQELSDEYREAADKRAVVLKYLPQVDEALADAKAMKIPPKYEAKKDEYLKMFEAFVLATKLYVQLGK